MRSTWKRAFATLLTIALLASLLVVPAAAVAEDDLSKGYWLNDSISEWAEIAAGTTAADTAIGTKKDDNTGYFTLIKAGTAKSVSDVSITAEGAFEGLPTGGDDKLHGVQLDTGENDTEATKYLKFTTTNPATVKAWFVTSGGVKAEIAIWDSENKESTVATMAATTKGEQTMGSCKLTTAGTYILGAKKTSKTSNTVTLYALQVVETEVDPNAVPAVKVEASAESIEMTMGAAAEAALTFTVEPSNTTDELEVKSGNDKVATWANGTVAAVAIGKTTITATAGEKSATCDVSVEGADQDGPVYIFNAGNMGEGSLPDGKVVYDNYFAITASGSTVVADAKTFGTNSDDWYLSGTKYLAPGTNGSKTQRSVVFTTAAETSTVEVWWKQNASSDTPPVQRDISLDGVLASGLIGSAVDGVQTGETAFVKNNLYHVTYSNVAAGEHYVAAAGGGGEYIFQIRVTEEETSEDEVDFTALETAITAAEKLDLTLATSADGSDIDQDAKWVTEEMKTELTETLATAKGLKDKESVTQTEVDEAVKALNDAAAGYKPADGTKPKTMTGVTAANVNATYNGQPKQITVTGAPAGATITYCATQDGTYAADPITVTNVADSPKTVYYKVAAAGYETFSSSATITVGKAAAPDISITVLNDEIPAEGRTVTFTVRGIPAASTTPPTAECNQAAEGSTISFTKQADGTYKGTNVVAASGDGSARTHTVTMTWADPNYVTVTKTVTLHQLAQGSVVAAEAAGLAVWDGVDYAALGVAAEASAEDNAVALTIDEAAILDAYAKDPATFKSGSMNHGGNAYMMVQFEAPAGLDKATWTVKQTVNGGEESAAWKLDGTAGDLDCWTVGDKTYIGDWFGVLMGVEGSAQTMPEENTYVMRYNFYNGDTCVAAVKYTVVRHVVEAVSVSVAANADLADVTAFKASPSEELTLTVAVKDGVDKILPETITVTLNGEAMAAADYTWDKATGKVTIAAAQLTAGDTIVVTVAPVVKPAEEYTITVTGGTADKAKAAAGASVTVTAAAAPTGKVFDKWTATGLTLTAADAAKATLTFTMPAANVTLTAAYKDEQGGEVEDSVIFDPAKLTVAADNTPVTTEMLQAVYGDRFSAAVITSGDHADYVKARRNSDGVTTSVEIKESGKASFSFVIKPGETFNVTATLSSNNGTDATAYTLKKGDAEVKSGDVGASKTPSEVTWEGLTEGTYTLTSSGAKSMRIIRLEMAPVGTGGETVDKTALTAALAAAKAIDTAAVKTSADGSDVATTEQWVTPAVKDALVKAIADAEALGETATQAQVDAATEALTDATAAWKPAAGTKTEGDEPAKPANKTALQTAITNAEKKVPADIYVVGEDTKVSEVNYGTKFMTESDKAAYDTALAAAKALLEKEDATQAEVDAAVAALNKAAGKVKNGTKGAPASSGGSTSRGDDASATGTETKADGSVVTTTTDRQGNKTVVTQRPDGSKITAVIKADGSVTIAAVNADGESVADVKVPGTMPTNPQRFVDVPDEHWAAKSINDMAVLGVVRGVDDVNHIFDMKSDITRGGVATILFRFSNGKTGLANAFSDVADDKWYTDGVAWASKVGVVNGFEDGTFRPENSITRAQLATMIARYAKIIGLDTTTNGDLSAFVDGAAVQSWAVDGMAWCVANGIVNGRGNNTLAPNASASRAEAAAMFDRFIQLLK